MKKVLALGLVAVGAFAHTSMLESGSMMSGFMHPLSGLDHILTMVGVGMLAFFASKKITPFLVAFIGAMILAAIAGYAGVAFMGVEQGIMLSVAVVFGLLGFAKKVPQIALISIVAFFGLFHGYAHGAEFSDGVFAQYILGFSLSTLALHLSGIALAKLYSAKVRVANV